MPAMNALISCSFSFGLINFGNPHRAFALPYSRSRRDVESTEAPVGCSGRGVTLYAGQTRERSKRKNTENNVNRNTFVVLFFSRFIYLYPQKSVLFYYIDGYHEGDTNAGGL